jgi:peptide/nickel transport system substrate-binding protein
MVDHEVTEVAQSGRQVSRRGFLGVAGAGVVGGSALGLLGSSVVADFVGGGASAAGAATKIPTGGTLRYSISSDATILDPASATLGVGQPTSGMPAACLYDTLALLNSKSLVVVPRQLTSLTVDATGAIWTLKLRPNLTFTDGTAFDASAIKAEWDRIALPATASTLRTTLTGWTYVVTDPQTLTVTLPSPQGNFPENMTLNLGAIPSPAAVAKYGKLYGSGPGYVVGAGPFTLTAWVPGNSYTLTKNPNYYIAGQPYLDAISIQVITNEAVNLEAMLSKTVDVGYFSGPDVNTHTLLNEGYQNASATFPATYGVQFNFSKAPFSDPRLRQALLLATDCSDANLKSTGGYAQVASGPGSSWYPKGSPFYDPSVKQVTNNLKAAQKLVNAYIAEKGAIPAQGIVIPNVSYLVALGTALTQQWAKLTGLTITTNVVSTTQAILLYAQGNFGLAVTLVPGYLWPADAYTALYTGQAANITHYSNPKMDALLTSVRGASTLSARKTGVNQIAQILVSDFAYVRIYYSDYHNFAQSNVGGLNTFVWGTGGAWPLPSSLYLKS